MGEGGGAILALFFLNYESSASRKMLLEIKYSFTDKINLNYHICYHNFSFHFSVGCWKTVAYAMIPIRKDSCLGLYDFI